jgi:hypothetical protein
MRRIVFPALVSALCATAFAQQPLALSTRGDFDGDGRRDVAKLTANGSSYRLVAQLSSEPREIVISEGNDSRYGDFLGTVPPGTYTPSRACEDHPKPVVVKHEAISYGSSEASESVIYWTGKKFEWVCIGD